MNLNDGARTPNLRRSGPALHHSLVNDLHFDVTLR
jgi:hypothetical protein